MTDYEKQRYVQTYLVNDHAKSKVLGNGVQTTTEHYFDLWQPITQITPVSELSQFTIKDNLCISGRYMWKS